MARMAVLLAGLPESVAGVTMNRLCASGLAAVVVGLPRRDRRRRRPVRGRRRGVDEPGAVGHRQARARASSAATARSTTRRWAGGSPTRACRRCSRWRAWARPARTWPSAGASRGRTRTRSRCARSGAGPRRRRPGASPTSWWRSAELTADEHPRPETSAERLATLKPAFRAGRHRHRGQLERHQRRRGRAGDRKRGAGARARGRAAGRVPRQRRGRRRPARDGDRPDPGRAQAARPHRHGRRARSTWSS